ncbi:PspC domain-containing protein [Robertkochia aurantiaca]|uniref:PspC domain-containing protein n=1 Tax=Robertkochia aurantiaca TaxID=2873700 RepID=UPI001CCDBA2D|nr:PspC domain-containing protein [Robertkochia sp. 3YJGBD-33]
MNKTININLANTFFHIDENAYLKLQRYLDAIRRSFTDSQGRDEIIADIEARIAELFSERMQHERQVISVKEVDEIITIMGQPEDYLVDDEIFDDQPRATRSKSTQPAKKLYRDTDHKYIAGVCSGLGHYLGIDAIWVRLFFLLFAVFSSGFGILAYILFWILVPEATTTAEKIAMTGEPVNITNIEKKIKEGIDNVTDRVKSVDYDQVGENVKKGSRNFFDSLGDILFFLLKVAGKFIGILLLIIGGAAMVALFIGLFTAGTLDVFGGGPWTDLVYTSVDAPVWLVSLLSLFAVGIPFFVLFYLGLKILVNNLKSMGNVARFSLLGIWLLSLIGLIVLGVTSATQHSFSGNSTNEVTLYTAPVDTLEIGMNTRDRFTNRIFNDSDFDIVYDGEQKMIYSDDIDFRIRSSEDSTAYMKITKEAQGGDFQDAAERAEKIQFNHSFSGNLLTFDDHWTTDIDNKFREQEVNITLHLPVNTVIYLKPSVRGHIVSTPNNMDYYGRRMAGHYWKVEKDGELRCLDCPGSRIPDTDESGTENPSDSLAIETDTTNA